MNGASFPDTFEWDVVLLEELEIPYVARALRFEDVRKKQYLEINSNGRAPGILAPFFSMNETDVG